MVVSFTLKKSVGHQNLIFFTSQIKVIITKISYFVDLVSGSSKGKLLLTALPRPSVAEAVSAWPGVDTQHTEQQSTASSGISWQV